MPKGVFVRSAEHLKNMSLVRIGKSHGPRSEETKRKISKSKIGKKHSSESIKKMRISHLGQVAWNRGIRGEQPGHAYLTEIYDGKTMLTHRLVMQDRMGRRLEPFEIVHHWDENKKNNAVENLSYFRHQSAHHRLHDFAKRHGIPIVQFKFEQDWLIEDYV